MLIFITGGAGFIGSNFIRHLLSDHPDYRIINFDKLTYAGNLDNLGDVESSPRYSFVRGDICDRAAVDGALGAADVVVNFAAESHVDRSIERAADFVETNVKGTQILLDAARQAGVSRFVQVSTDEVMGSCAEGEYFTESSPLRPNSPYAASKAAAEHLVRAAHVTFGLDVVTTRASNNYGPYQFPEKLVPLMISNALDDRPLPVYGDGLNVRDWLYVEDCCRAIDAVLHKGRAAQVYNIGSRAERNNLEVVDALLGLLGKPRSLIKFVADRPGHDRRYATDPSRIEDELGWRPRETFESGMEKTVRWYRDNAEWIARTRSGEYQLYYERMYGGR
ncbi:MAG TPA: dTDP-glucose 4,6-dehydratase [Blastocatellia bacterium]|jgi:dTDP-glucose 4,6-dehydratase|nr:dTDP-glucose 4,6-dehydratase [Blastocatellia bacterium]